MDKQMKQPRTAWLIDEVLDDDKTFGFRSYISELEFGVTMLMHQRFRNGEPPLEGYEWPTTFWISPNAASRHDNAKIPPVFSIGGIFGITQQMYEVFSRFELGKSQLIPVDLFKSDRQTRFEGQHYMLYRGEHKVGFEMEHSRNFSPPRPESKKFHATVIASRVEDGDICLNASVLSGADVWRDANLGSGLFFSDPLMTALVQANAFDASFRHRRCRILEG